MDRRCEIRNDQDKLLGYALEKDGKRYLALFKKDKCLGKIEAEYLYSKLTNGPCLVECQPIQD
ncbi:hypothetical protein DWY07_10900 [Clostridium sp. AF23-6LB]|nr:hypothetical protein DWY07_10900 [Clostridium sp. AF23-6LB]